MAETVRDVMIPNPLTIDASSSVQDAANVMRSNDIGDVLISDGERLRGILTDRDVVVRCVAPGLAADMTAAGDCCSPNLLTVEADAPVAQAVDLMRGQSLRRLPVVDDDRVVGIVSLGDLAVDRDRRSALADISAAPPNR
jgi:CBS domain-containing protein